MTASRSSTRRCATASPNGSSSSTTCAVALERGELEVHFQPIVTLPDGRGRGLRGAGALVAPDARRIVPPAKFIPIAEDSGLITEIGAWVLDQACRQLAAGATRSRARRSCTCAVNLSARQLRDPMLVGRVPARADRQRLPARVAVPRAHRVGLLMDDRRRPGCSTTCATLGVRLSIDDFGTGYSSLAYLSGSRSTT